MQVGSKAYRGSGSREHEGHRSGAVEDVRRVKIQGRALLNKTAPEVGSRLRDG